MIDPSSNKVQLGVIFNVNPVEGGEIICNNVQTPPNIYLYVDAGTTCTAKHNPNYYYDGWVENVYHNSSVSVVSDFPDLTVNRYGTFTANFKPSPPIPPPDYTFLFITVIVTTIIGWSIPSIAGWLKTKMQFEHLEECINQIGKSDKNTIEDKINGYYVEGKISEDHRQFLKERISEYYGSVKGSESGA